MSNEENSSEDGKEFEENSAEGRKDAEEFLIEDKISEDEEDEAGDYLNEDDKRKYDDFTAEGDGDPSPRRQLNLTVMSGHAEDKNTDVLWGNLTAFSLHRPSGLVNDPADLPEGDQATVSLIQETDIPDTPGQTAVLTSQEMESHIAENSTEKVKLNTTNPYEDIVSDIQEYYSEDSRQSGENHTVQNTENEKSADSHKGHIIADDMDANYVNVENKTEIISEEDDKLKESPFKTQPFTKVEEIAKALNALPPSTKRYTDYVESTDLNNKTYSNDTMKKDIKHGMSKINSAGNETVDYNNTEASVQLSADEQNDSNSNKTEHREPTTFSPKTNSGSKTYSSDKQEYNNDQTEKMSHQSDIFEDKEIDGTMANNGSMQSIRKDIEIENDSLVMDDTRKKNNDMNNREITDDVLDLKDEIMRDDENVEDETKKINNHYMVDDNTMRDEKIMNEKLSTEDEDIIKDEEITKTERNMKDRESMRNEDIIDDKLEMHDDHSMKQELNAEDWKIMNKDSDKLADQLNMNDEKMMEEKHMMNAEPMAEHKSMKSKLKRNDLKNKDMMVQINSSLDSDDVDTEALLMDESEVVTQLSIPDTEYITTEMSSIPQEKSTLKINNPNDNNEHPGNEESKQRKINRNEFFRSRGKKGVSLLSIEEIEDMVHKLQENIELGPGYLPIIVRRGRNDNNLAEEVRAGESKLLLELPNFSPRQLAVEKEESSPVVLDDVMISNVDSLARKSARLEEVSTTVRNRINTLLNITSTISNKLRSVGVEMPALIENAKKLTRTSARMKNIVDDMDALS